MRLLQHPLALGRAIVAALSWGAGIILGPLLLRQKRSRRPVIAFQAYAEHLLYFYGPLIQRLLRDDCADVVLLTWPHPHFPWNTQAKLRAIATGEFGLDAARVVPYWRACWWHFDLMITNDVLALPLLRRTRTCQMFHGPIIPERFFRRALCRRPVYEANLAFPFGPYARDQILAACDGRPEPVRIHAVGSPGLDKYFHPARSKRDYLRALGLTESQPVVVYAPHWYDVGKMGCAGVDLIRAALRELAKLPVQVIVKLHAMSMILGASRGQDWGTLLRTVESSRMRVDQHPEDVHAMLAADVLVTDISSRALNVMLLDKPVVLYPGMLPSAGAFDPPARELYCRGATVAHTPHELGEQVRAALANPRTRSEQRGQVAKELFANPGHATAEVTRILYSELKLVPEKAGLLMDEHQPV